MMRRAGLILMFLATLLTGTDHLCAETIKISGVNFNVQGYQELAGGMVQVTMDGKRTIVSKSGVNEWIVRALAGSLSEQQLEVFIRNSLAESAIPQAESGLKSLMVKPGWKDSAPLISNLSNSDQGIKVIKAVYGGFTLIGLDRTSRELIAPHIARIGVTLWLKDEAWFRDQGLVTALKVSGQLKALVTSLYFSAIEEKKNGGRKSLAGLASFVFGLSDPDVERLMSIEDLAQKVDDIKDKGDPERMIQAVSECRKGTECSKYLYHEMASWLNTTAMDQIKSGNPAGAVSILARSDAGRDTPEIHETVIKALQTDSYSIADNREQPVEPFLARLAANNVRIKELLVSQYEKEALTSLEKKDYEPLNLRKFENLFNKILQLRSDPQEKNDALRLRLYEALKAEGWKEEGAAVLRSVKTGLPLHYSAVLLFDNLRSGGFAVVSCFLLFLLSISFYICLKIRQLLVEYRDYREETEAVYSGRQGGQRRSRGPTVEDKSGAAILNPLVNEYEACLSVLGLRRGVSSKEIKAVYRKAMKTVHPDIASHGGEKQTSTKFIELQQAYQRALTLHKELGLPE